MVHHEGLLELDAIYLFEASPEIVRYREQPATIHYPDGAKLRRYTPDFELLLVTGECVSIEVKPACFLAEEEMRHKLDRIKEHMRRSNASFVILTDETLRQEPRLSNLRWIYHQAARVPAMPDAADIALNAIRDHFPTSIKVASALLAERRIEPFSLLLAGRLRCPLALPISSDTPINLATESDNGWFWIAKEHGF